MERGEKGNIGFLGMKMRAVYVLVGETRKIISTLRFPLGFTVARGLTVRGVERCMITRTSIIQSQNLTLYRVSSISYRVESMVWEQTLHIKAYATRWNTCLAYRLKVRFRLFPKEKMTFMSRFPKPNPKIPRHNPPHENNSPPYTTQELNTKQNASRKKMMI